LLPFRETSKTNYTAPNPYLFCIFINYIVKIKNTSKNESYADTLTSISISVSNSSRTYQIIYNAQSNLHTYYGTYGRRLEVLIQNLRVNRNHKISCNIFQHMTNERTSKNKFLIYFIAQLSSCILTRILQNQFIRIESKLLQNTQKIPGITSQALNQNQPETNRDISRQSPSLDSDMRSSRKPYIWLSTFPPLQEYHASWNHHTTDRT